MKMNLVRLSFMLVPLLSVNGYALEIYKGKVTQHKEWNTANVKFKVANGLATFIPTHVKRSADNAYTSIYSQLHPQTTKTNVATLIEAQQSITVVNTSDESQTYQYFFALCAETDATHAQCGQYMDEITLESKGYYTTNQQPELTVVFDKPGLHRATIVTGILLKDKNGNPRSEGYSNTSGIVKVE